MNWVAFFFIMSLPLVLSLIGAASHSVVLLLLGVLGCLVCSLIGAGMLSARATRGLLGASFIIWAFVLIVSNLSLCFLGCNTLGIFRQ